MLLILLQLEESIYSQQTTPREKKSTNFLPDITAPSPYNITHRPSKGQKPVFTRSFSLSEYWTDLKTLHFPSSNNQRQQHELTNHILSKSAPVITKTFEESLLPTHNIFFAGRPRTPKPKKITKSSSDGQIIAPVILRRQKRPPHNRRVTFVDSPSITNNIKNRSAKSKKTS